MQRAHGSGCGEPTPPPLQKEEGLTAFLPANVPESVSASPPPQTSLTTPPLRSLTLPPRAHYVAAPVLSVLQRKELLPQPPPTPPQPYTSATGTENMVDLYSSFTAPSSSANETLRVSTEANSLEVEAASRSSSHDDGTQRVPAAPQNHQHVRQQLVCRPRTPPASVGASPRKSPASSQGSSQRRVVPPSRRRGHTGSVSHHRKPDDGSAMRCDVPHLNPSSLGSTTESPQNSASTPALMCSLTYGDSVTTVDARGVGADVKDAETAVPAAKAAAAAAAVSKRSPLHPTTLTPATTDVFLCEAPSSTPAATSQPPPRMRRAPSPPLLPAWVYALSEHVGPRLPSPLEANLHDATGDEVVTFHVEHAATAAVLPARRRSVEGVGSPLHPRTHSTLTANSSSLVSTTPFEVRSIAAASSLSSGAHASRLTDGVGVGDRVHVDAPAAPVSGSEGGGRVSPLFASHRRSLPPMEGSVGEDEASSQPLLPVFALSRIPGSGAAAAEASTTARLANTEWRLERAVQAGSSAEDALAEEERSRASLYAADEMSKPASPPSFPLT